MNPENNPISGYSIRKGDIKELEDTIEHYKTFIFLKEKVKDNPEKSTMYDAVMETLLENIEALKKRLK